MTINRFAVWVAATLVCGAGALFSEIGFSDIASVGGTLGLLYWIPSVAVGLWGAHQLSDGSSRARWVGGVVSMLLPAYVLIRWLSLLIVG
ncbi:MAG: hypothetical protein WA726_10740 [Acidimicrobiia bacterium]